MWSPPLPKCSGFPGASPRPLPGNDVSHQSWFMATSWGITQNASVTKNGFTAKSGNPRFSIYMGLPDQVNIASVISAPCFVILELQSKRKLMGQIKDNGKCICSSTFLSDTAVVFSPSELVFNISALGWVSVTLRGYPYFPLVTWRAETNMNLYSLQATLNWKGAEARIWWGQGGEMMRI